jgi:two-component system sensor histidine kinase PilS (NtrC family)
LRVKSGRTLLDLVLPEDSSIGPGYRRRVEWLVLLRLVVTSLLLGATIFFQLSQTGAYLTYPTIALYVLIAATFLLSLLYAVYLPLIPNLWGFAFIQVVVDVFYYTALVYFTGGAAGIFSLIYIFPIVASGFLLFRRGALLIASLAAILFGLMITLEFHGIIPAGRWPLGASAVRPTPGYILWVMAVHFTAFYLSAFVAGSVAEKLRKTETRLELKETDLATLSELHAGIVRSIPSGIVTTDESDRITFVNSAGARLLGAPLDQLINAPLREVLPGVREVSRAGARAGDTYGTTKEIKGEKAYLELSVSNLKAKDGGRSGRLVIFEDVTRLRKMEERVKAGERMAALVRVGAGMAHEIRNPLGALRGAAELLSQYPDEIRDAKKLLDIVVRESDRLNSLLSDFMVTVNPDRGQKTLVMLDAIVEETCDLFSRERGIPDRISLETFIGKSVEVEGDPVRLKQAVWNLLANAFEAVPDKGTVKVTLVSDEDSRLAILSVRDSGTGISPEIRDRIFDPFTTTRSGGAGLGLPLALSIVEGHKGTIEIDAAAGGGTRVEVRLPLAEAAGVDKEGERLNG